MNNKSNTIIACNSPKNSACTKENECSVLDFMEKQLAKFSALDQIIIGDFNSRIDTKLDFVVENWKDLTKFTNRTL